MFWCVVSLSILTWCFYFTHLPGSSKYATTQKHSAVLHTQTPNQMYLLSNYTSNAMFGQLVI